MVEKKRSRHGLDLDSFNEYAAQLQKMPDPELVLLRAHMLAERVLVQVLAARLREPDAENVPRLSFDRLIDLAIRKHEDRKPFIWFNELRNALAHEFNALDGAELRRSASKFGIDWPAGASERRKVIGVLSDYILVLSWQAYFSEMTEQITLERAARLSEDAEPYLKQAVELIGIVKKIEERLGEFGKARQQSAAPPLPSRQTE